MNINDLPSSQVVAEAQTANPGTGYTAFANSPCAWAKVHNPNGVDLEVRLDGAGATLTIPAYGSKTLFGVRNLNAISVRRVDQSNTQVYCEAEAYRA